MGGKALDDVDGLADIPRSVFEVDDVDAAATVCGDERADSGSGVAVPLFEVKRREHGESVDNQALRREKTRVGG